MIMDITQLLGWIATVLFSIMLIPQIIKTIKLKDTNNKLKVQVPEVHMYCDSCYKEIINSQSVNQ